VTSICLTGKEDLAAIPFNRYFPQRTYGLVQRKGKLASPQAARFMAMLTDRASTVVAPRPKPRHALTPDHPIQNGQD
jgi:hypothetical protein